MTNTPNEEQRPCETVFMRCVALAMPGSMHCIIHAQHPRLVPRELTEAERKDIEEKALR